MEAVASHDVWAFGVVLYEMCAGQDLFPKDINDDTIAARADRESLQSWIEPKSDVLEHVFSTASAMGKVTAMGRLMAQDIIALCLQGNPSDRPKTMAEVLSHPFFGDELPPYPVLPPHLGGNDIIFSYQSTQVALLHRTRRFLNAIGITTADGTQVPPGADWRQWYFHKLNESKVFVAILSRNYYASPACWEEAAMCQKKQMPVMNIAHDAAEWQSVMTTGHYTDEEGNSIAVADDSHIAMYQEIFPVETWVPPNGTFQGDFVSNILALIERLQQHLPEDTTVHAVALCATNELEFAKKLCTELQACKLNVQCCGADFNWDADSPTQPQFKALELVREAQVVVPVLSKSFLLSATCYHLMINVGETISYLPVLHSMSSYSEVFMQHDSLVKEDPELAQRLPYLASVLNRANRVPPNNDFGAAFHANLHTLGRALRMVLTQERSLGALMEQRIPKYASMLTECAVTPMEGSWDTTLHLNALLKLIMPEHFDEREQHGPGCGTSLSHTMRGGSDQERRAPDVVITYAGDIPHNAALDLQRALSDQDVRAVVLAEKDPAWFAVCEQVRACVPLLCPQFVASTWCEGQITFAKDNTKMLCPIMLDRAGFQAAMSGRTTSQQDSAQLHAEVKDLKRQLSLARVAAGMADDGRWHDPSIE